MRIFCCDLTNFKKNHHFKAWYCRIDLTNTLNSYNSLTCHLQKSPTILSASQHVGHFSFGEFFDEFFWRIFWQIFLMNYLTNFFDELFDELFWRIFLSDIFNEFFWQIFLMSCWACNLLTIASFRIGVLTFDLVFSKIKKLRFSFFVKQAQTGFWPPNAMKVIGYFQNLRDLLRIFLEFLWIFGNFLVIF